VPEVETDLIITVTRLAQDGMLVKVTAVDEAVTGVAFPNVNTLWIAPVNVLTDDTPPVTVLAMLIVPAPLVTVIPVPAVIVAAV